MAEEKNRRTTLNTFGFNLDQLNPNIVTHISLEALTTTSKENPNITVTERLERLMTVYSQLNGDIPEVEKDELKQGIQVFGISSHLVAQQTIFESIKKLFVDYKKAEAKIDELFIEYQTKSRFTPQTTIDQYELLMTEYNRAVIKDLENLQNNVTATAQKLDKVIFACQKYEDLHYKNSCTVSNSEQAATKYMALLNSLSNGETKLTTIGEAKNHAREAYITERHQKQVLQNWKKELPNVDALKKKLENVQFKQEQFVHSYKVRHNSMDNKNLIK